ncbi:MAG: hypothetical protein ACO1NK_02435, partial [Sediminibacterium sp.]
MNSAEQNAGNDDTCPGIFGPAYKYLLKQAQQLENAYKNAMMNMAQMTSLTDYLLAMLVMALAPAVF